MWGRWGQRNSILAGPRTRARPPRTEVGAWHAVPFREVLAIVDQQGIGGLGLASAIYGGYFKLNLKITPKSTPVDDPQPLHVLVVRHGRSKAVVEPPRNGAVSGVVRISVWSVGEQAHRVA